MEPSTDETALHERIAGRLRAAPAETLAAAVGGEREMIVIGSQAIHAWIEDDIPEAAMGSFTFQPGKEISNLRVGA